MISLDFLEKVEVFRDLDDDQLSAVQECCNEAEYRRDEKIFGINEDPLYLFVVMDGEVELRLDQSGNNAGEKGISRLTGTMIFGWSSLVPPFEYRLSAYCVSRNCKVVKIDTKCLTRHFSKDSGMGYSVMSGIVSVVGSRFFNLREEVIKNRGMDIMNQW